MIIDPNVIRHHLKVPIVIILELFSIFLIFFIFWIIVFINKIQYLYISALDFVRILLSIPIKNVPKLFSKRLIFLSLVVFSMFYSTNILANLTKLKIVVEDMSFDSLEDVYKSGIEIFTEKDLIISYIKNDTLLYPDTLKPKMNILEERECLEKILVGHKIICIVHNIRLEMYSNYYKQYTFMKDLKFHIRPKLATFMYEPGYPYIERFDQIMQRIIDHGLSESFDKSTFHILEAKQ